MRIQFCGADRTVTGTCHFLEINGLRIFLDMGMYQGRREEARRLNEWMPDDARTADAVILSHGHLDHCGKLPMLTKAGYQGPIFCTAATAAVARVVLEDAGEIQEEDAAYLNRRSRPPGEESIKPLYTRSDVRGVLRLFQNVPYGVRTDLGNDVCFTLRDAGHIIGSAYVIIEWIEKGRKRSLLFTADIGRYNTPIIRDPEALPGPVDQFITESTYGTISHGAHCGRGTAASGRGQVLRATPQPPPDTGVCGGADADHALVHAEVHPRRRHPADPHFRGQPDGRGDHPCP